MTKPSRPRRAEREGTVRALRDTGLHATSELPGTTGTPHPRYRMTEMPLPGQIRVVPWSEPAPPLTGAELIFLQIGVWSVHAQELRPQRAARDVPEIL